MIWIVIFIALACWAAWSVWPDFQRGRRPKQPPGLEGGTYRYAYTYVKGSDGEEIPVTPTSAWTSPPIKLSVGDIWDYNGLLLTWTGRGWITHAVQPDVEVERLRKARRTTDFTRCPFIMPITIDGKEKQCALWEGHAGNHEWKMHEGQCE